MSSSMLTIQTARMSMFCRAHGDARNGLPMLLLHGSYASSRWWEPFFAILPDEIYAVAPDLRGCGGSDKTEDGYAIDEQAADIHTLVNELGWREFDLVGHSSSGAIAMEYALTHREQLNSLVLLNSVPIEGAHTPPEAMAALEAMRDDRVLLSQALATLMPTFPVDALLNPDNYRFFDQLVDDAAQMARAAFTAGAMALEEWNRSSETAALTLPALIVWGDADTIVTRSATTRTLIAIPGAANLEVLRGVGHSPMIEAPLLLAERILDFLSEDFDGFDSIRRSIDDDSDANY